VHEPHRARVTGLSPHPSLPPKGEGARKKPPCGRLSWRRAKRAAHGASARSGGGSGRSGSSSGVSGGRSGTGSSGSSGVGSGSGGRGGSGSSSGGRSGRGRRLFLLAAGRQGGGGNQGGQNERFLHFSFLLRDGGRRFRNFCPAGQAARDRVERLELSPAQPKIITRKGFFSGLTLMRERVQRPRVVAGKEGLALSSHSLRASRSSTRRSGSLPQ